MSGDGDMNQVVPLGDPVGRVIVEPSRPRQVDLQPGMRGARTGHADLAAVQGRIVQITRDEAAGDAQPAQGLDHQPGVVPAGPGSLLQRFPGRLGAFRIPRLILKIIADGIHHPLQKVGRFVTVTQDETLGPIGDPAVGVIRVRMQVDHQVDPFLGGVLDRQGFRPTRQREILKTLEAVMHGAKPGRHGQLLGRLAERHDGDIVGPRVACPVNRGSDVAGDRIMEDAAAIAPSGQEHRPMFAEGHRVGILVGRGVFDFKNDGHGGWTPLQ